MTFFLGLFNILPNQVYAETAQPNNIIISEIKLGGGDEPKEFVTLYNQSDSTIDLTGYKIQYAKPAFSIDNCQIAEWSDFSYGSEVELNGEIVPGGVVTITNLPLTDSLGGTVRIIDSLQTVQDLLAWDKISTTPSLAPCLDDPSNRLTAPWPAAGKRLQRYVDCDSKSPIDGDNNFQDFFVSDLPSPGSLGNTTIGDCEPPEDDDSGGLGSGPEVENSCSGIIISELLVNPDGSDSGNEFIELYNPSSNSISLFGCKLQTSASSKIYIFDNISIAAKKYKAFYSDQTLLTLTNSSGGTVWLFDADESEVFQVDYEADLDDDVSWSLVDGKWSASYIVTPESNNKLQTIKPCPFGQIRNLETNRCNNIVEEATLAPCLPGKERNPETNRCRNIATLASVLKACNADQYRNPETNRCKKISSTTNSLKPCEPGQERNPATNRCRKAAGVLSDAEINDVKDVVINPQYSFSSWVLAIASLVGAAFYAVWEWRNEILVHLMTLRQKLL